MSNAKNTILVIDADPVTQKTLSVILPAQDFQIVPCSLGVDAIRLFVTRKPQLVLLDLDLPDMEGKTLITTLREWSSVPIVILTARTRNAYIVESLDMGANDFITKPFSADVLLSRINASLRSAAIHDTGQPTLTNGPLTMDLVRHQVMINNEPLPLTPKEYRLLHLLMINCGKMLPHRTILKEIWGDAHCDDIQYLRVLISQLRSKIEKNAASPVLIITDPGIGYRMEQAEDVTEHNQQTPYLFDMS